MTDINGRSASGRKALIPPVAEHDVTPRYNAANGLERIETRIWRVLRTGVEKGSSA